jgi:hypothetical protein
MIATTPPGDILRTITEHFQHAAEPLFNNCHIDSDFRMDVVFPGCFQSASFLNALLFSVVKTASRGECSRESLRLQSKVLFHLRKTVTTTDKDFSPSDVGTILILQGTAVRVRFLITDTTNKYIVPLE